MVTGLPRAGRELGCLASLHCLGHTSPEPGFFFFNIRLDFHHVSRVSHFFLLQSCFLECNQTWSLFSRFAGASGPIQNLSLMTRNVFLPVVRCSLLCFLFHCRPGMLRPEHRFSSSPNNLQLRWSLCCVPAVTSTMGSVLAEAAGLSVGCL